MLITEQEIVKIREKACRLLLEGHPNPNVPDRLIELLGPFGVERGFLGYVNLERPINRNTSGFGLSPEDFFHNNNYQPSKEKPIFIAEARGRSISDDSYKAEDFLNNVLPYDYYSVGNAYRVYQDTMIFVAHKSEALFNSKLYRKFYSQMGKKDFFVFVFSINGNNFKQVVWLCLSCSKRLFSDDEIIALKKLFITYGLRWCIQGGITRGSELEFLAKPFTDIDWKFAKHIAESNRLGDKQSIADQLHKSVRAIESRLENILAKRELVETEGKSGLLETVHALFYNKPLITWFDQRVLKPKGDDYFALKKNQGIFLY